MKLEVSREAVLHNAKLQSFYSGESKKDDLKLIDIATKMQASDDDDDMLNIYMNTASAKVVDMLASLMGEVKLTDGEKISEKTGEPSPTIVFDIDVPSTFDGNSKETLLTGVTDYISNWVLFEWMSVVYPNEAKGFFDKCELVISDIRKRVNRRVKPVRRVASPL